MKLFPMEYESVRATSDDLHCTQIRSSSARVAVPVTEPAFLATYPVKNFSTDDVERAAII
jgi:hypothetical protein